jgi:hypothetical protein
MATAVADTPRYPVIPSFLLKRTPTTVGIEGLERILRVEWRRKRQIVNVFPGRTA